MIYVFVTSQIMVYVFVTRIQCHGLCICNKDSMSCLCICDKSMSWFML